ncbi:MAG: sialate O-acetylesterase [Verrucomicrobiales bacterium]|nr:sialate O-acetylesterase [Verrucomicrobiales bacterium]
MNVKPSFCPALLPVLLALLAISSPANELQIAKIFFNHAVMQQGVPVPVWGRTGPGETVTVEFAGQKELCKADDTGAWHLKLAPLEANGTGRRMTITSGERKLEISDLLVGEVWYASGQSNMQMTLGSCAKKLALVQDVIAQPDGRLIRTVRLGNPDTELPLADLPEVVEWQGDSPENRKNHSAVAFFFARELHDKLHVPVGIIEASWGGKPIEGFIPKGEFEKHQELKPILDLSEADELEKLKHIEGGVVIRNTAGRPGRIFNARVSPVAPYAVRGILWYQGESNAGTGEDPRNYRIKTRALVDGWRRSWGQPGLPFYFVQLPSFKDTAVGWIQLREEQRLSLQIPNTGMAVTIDLRDSDIHPANKVDVGKRLARWALAKTYGKDVFYSGPLFAAAKIEENQIRVHFDHAAEGLMIAEKDGLDEPREQKDTLPAHFELCDELGEWHPAVAQIEGETVVVKSESVLRPVAVRYACEGDPENANLYNRAGLPASPFCSNLDLPGSLRN